MWFKKKTLQECVDNQKAKDLHEKFITWRHRVEPFLIKRGDSVQSIIESEKLYFSDDDFRERIDYLWQKRLNPYRHFCPTNPDKK